MLSLDLAMSNQWCACNIFMETFSPFWECSQQKHVKSVSYVLTQRRLISGIFDILSGRCQEALLGDWQCRGRRSVTGTGSHHEAAVEGLGRSGLFQSIAGVPAQRLGRIVSSSSAILDYHQNDLVVHKKYSILEITGRERKKIHIYRPPYL